MMGISLLISAGWETLQNFVSYVCQLIVIITIVFVILFREPLN